ncbi:tripartite tricarboxylate transporter substrate binding protein [Siccirubricoccus sp. KC 17139]|uniref:Tripartite tricarboxylate transporter substrate binding protein n=1 Tax=Siccirubricoccus soli TaxID=2899147 RepID=A0ABT1D6I2_9PROT|nr:tripartite tricarboxylate transporter substrate binding protein [Siccirubricoccus soli]MCO6417543.1 tripartite tricarboxylate transporter substrate binding protein [Siccirubricoccus soli]MCP2683678.1 tripartite tricarboxylate transporter substrate binding protein [Siccirubricoccus soli]
MRRRAILAAPALLAALPARAQEAFPNRPVTILVASPAGGGTDFSARLIAEPLAQRLGVPVVVENRPGGNGSIGLLATARARPDGHTLTVGYSGTMTGRPAVEGVADLDPQKDFAPIALLTDTPQVMLVHPSLPVRTLPEFVAYAKQRPGQLNYASAGNGSLHHLGTELLKRRTGIDLVHVPYRGTGETISDLIAGRVQFYMNSPPPVIGFVRDGRLRAIATTGQQRHPALPEVPSLAEVGIADMPVNVWYALYAPARTPQPVQDRLAREVMAVLAMPEVQSRAAEAGTFVTPAAGPAVAARLAREIAAWTEVVKAAGIKPD